MICILARVKGLKILIAGDHDELRKPFFHSIAKTLASSSHGHFVFFLSNKVQPIFKTKETDRLLWYGIGTQHTFDWDNNLTEKENHKALDLKAAKAYFSYGPMLFEMKKQQFDIGIGGLAEADAMLFKYLSIPFIKIS